MAKTIREIASSDLKHKEQVAAMTELARKDKGALAELFDVLKTGNDVEKGTAAEVMKFVSQEAPELMLPHLDVLIEYIDYRAPRVRWGCPESIGHIARKYPVEVEKAIPKLLENLKDKSTVVRWCAAFALTEIAKHHRERGKELATVLETLSETEQNSGVRNLYVKALKEMAKA
ncbi:MAG TPA: hypothetical protein PKJ21_00675 [Anaerolineae bacterium]|nr:hypothetical protein [Anaerolineae bacterium]HNT04684.1 hypothetical protein [Anaerolineae bacterium]